MKKIIVIGSDHAGFEAKEEVKKILDNLGYEYKDVGTYTDEPIDFPLIAKRAARKILGAHTLGILICGSGEGMQIAANKINGIRADLCYDEYSAKMAREDNDANILTLRSREFNHEKYTEIVKTFLETPFSNEPRHMRRIAEIAELENL
ncbi:MAG: ribose 5-phosphate isomerase B [Nanoarchaeota archaeon]